MNSLYFHAMLIFLSILGPAICEGSDQNITTVAGTVECCPIPPNINLLCNNPCGDGGLAISAKLRRPFGVWVEPNGDLYIADTVNHRIRQVDAETGIITSIAGNTALGRGTSGLGGNALVAQLSFPSGVAVRDEEVYIVEGTGSNNGGSRVTKVDQNGNLVIVAGTGVSGFSGDGGLATSAQIGRDGGALVFGNLDDSIYFTDPANSRIRRIDPNGFISTVSNIGLILSFPSSVGVGLSIDPATGDLYTALPLGNGLVKITAGPDGIVAGPNLDPNESTSLLPVSGLNFPTYVHVVDDTVFVADQNNHLVKELDLSDNLLSILAGTVQGFLGDGGLATQARLNFPDGLTSEENGNLYVADRQNSRIRVFAVAPTLFDIEPNAVNSVARGKYATAYLEFPDEANHLPADVDVSTVTLAPLSASSALLDEPLPAYLTPTAVGDYNGNGITDRMVKFDRQDVKAWIDFGDTAQLRIDGKFNDGRYFTSTATIRFLTPPSQEVSTIEEAGWGL